MVFTMRRGNINDYDLLEKVPSEIIESLDQIDELLTEMDTLARFIGSSIDQVHTNTTSNVLGTSRLHNQTTYTLVYIVKRSEGGSNE